MFAYHLTAPRLDALSRVTLPTPRPGSGEVLIRLRAASLNYIDVAIATGAFPLPSYPAIPVSDGAGEIAEIGAGVAGWKPGDRVIPHFLPDWASGQPGKVADRRMRGVNMPGSLAEFVVMPSSGIVSLPDTLSFEEGACLPIAATTAWNAIRAAAVSPGSTVLVMGTGGVSLFALQFAKASGARVVVISSSDEKLERCRALGADATVNYVNAPDWDRRVLELTEGRGVDLVVETGGKDTFECSLSAAAIEGTVVSVGFLTGADLSFSLWPLNLKRLSIRGSNTGSVASLAEAVRAIATTGIRPVIDDRTPFADAPEALRALKAAKHFGKIVVTI